MEKRIEKRSLLKRFKDWRTLNMPEELPILITTPVPILVTATEENTEELIPPAIGGWFIVSVFIGAGLIVLFLTKSLEGMLLGFASIAIAIVLILYGLIRKSKKRK